MERISRLHTKKGKDAIAFAGFRYRKDKEHPSSNTISWRCTERSCNGRLKTSCTYENPVQTKQHNHFPCPDRVLADETIERMKNRAQQETIPIPLIYKQEISKTTADLMLNNSKEEPTMPSFYSIHSSMYTARHKSTPALPRTITDLTIPESLARTLSRREFLLHQSAADGLVVFATKENLQLLGRNEEFFMDATFDVVPLLFSQLFTIHAFTSGKQLPLVFALMTNKMAESYVALFRIIRDRAAMHDIVLNPKV